MKNVWTARKYSLLLSKYWHGEDFIWQWWCARDFCQIWLLMGENDPNFCFWLLDPHSFPNISMPRGWHWTHVRTHTHTQSCVFTRNWNQNPWITILFFFFLISISILQEHLYKKKKYTTNSIHVFGILCIHEVHKGRCDTCYSQQWHCVCYTDISQ